MSSGRSWSVCALSGRARLERATTACLFLTHGPHRSLRAWLGLALGVWLGVGVWLMLELGVTVTIGGMITSGLSNN